MSRLAGAVALRAALLYKYLPTKRAAEVALSEEAMLELGQLSKPPAHARRAVRNILDAYRKTAVGGAASTD